VRARRGVACRRLPTTRDAFPTKLASTMAVPIDQELKPDVVQIL